MNRREETDGDRGASHIQGLAYASTDNGIELPVLDVTHPSFVETIDERRLDEVSLASLQKLHTMGQMSDDQKRAYYRALSTSWIFGPVFAADAGAGCMSGMSTYAYKLGPHLIGGEPDRAFDRGVSTELGSVAARMRLRDLCRVHAGALIPQLASSPGKDLCMLNIGGGAASDSINTLALIQQENAELLRSRRIEINVLDVDTMGPRFAEASIQALRAEGHRFYGVEITCRPVVHDWQDTVGLRSLLPDGMDAIVACSSEGGLFEYGTDEEIVGNLDVLYDHAPDATRIAGTLLHEPGRVHATVLAMAEATKARARFLGVHGLARLLEKTGWRLESVEDRNPVYAVFLLKKDWE